jgi:hypothetical protein
MPRILSCVRGILAFIDIKVNWITSNYRKMLLLGVEKTLRLRISLQTLNTTLETPIVALY